MDFAGYVDLIKGLVQNLSKYVVNGINGPLDRNLLTGLVDLTG